MKIVLLSWIALAPLGCDDSKAGGGDAGAEGGPLVDPGSGDGEVGGTALDVHVTEGGPVTQPVDLSGRTIAALVQGGAGGFTRYAGSGRADGTFEVPGVPAQPYYLRVDDEYWFGSVRRWDLGRPWTGRADAVKVPDSSSTQLIVDATGLAPWEHDDDLTLFALGSAAWGSLLDGALDTPDDGVTELRGFHIDFARLLRPTLVEGGRGDRALIVQTRSHELQPGVTYHTITRVLRPEAFTMTLGASTRLVARSSPSPRTRRCTFRSTCPPSRRCAPPSTPPLLRSAAASTSPPSRAVARSCPPSRPASSICRPSRRWPSTPPCATGTPTPPTGRRSQPSSSARSSPTSCRVSRTLVGRSPW
jgi:hypothetical protein